ncbi:Response regulator receiver domain-containing protein [Lentzea xinjiangensis]|uniref:Response regulator receiver domain-containing protein n=1 Tax=Lentzea xinjiangensis TaxID=402600 RepID=A0A1H9MKJ3_9PSEU|nr:response regulator transcription factor [Lentzea xinjiangensis]SER23975.1 Response regulator receiver domain-containing protein [Lentzea xinjiangensis]
MIVRVLIADDDPLIRDVLRDVLDDEPDLRVVAVATDAREAVELAGQHAPAVVVLDVRMPWGGGPHAASAILRRAPATRILAFSAHTDPGTVDDMRRAGVSDYLAKGVRNTELVAAVRRLGARQVVVRKQRP